MEEFLSKLKKETTEVIAVDFDGVIHKNSKGFHDGTIYDDPVFGTKAALTLLSKQFKIVIFTCKAKPERPLIDGKTGVELIWEWLKKHNLDIYISDVTHEKPRARLYIDDKAIRFFDWAQVLLDMR